MAKNPNIYKFEIIESIIAGVDFTTKDEVLTYKTEIRGFYVFIFLTLLILIMVLIATFKKKREKDII